MPSAAAGADVVVEPVADHQGMPGDTPARAATRARNSAGSGLQTPGSSPKATTSKRSSQPESGEPGAALGLPGWRSGRGGRRLASRSISSAAPATGGDSASNPARISRSAASQTAAQPASSRYVDDHLDKAASASPPAARGLALGQEVAEGPVGPDAPDGLDVAEKVPVGERILIEEDVAHVEEDPADHPLTSNVSRIDRVWRSRTDITATDPR